MTAIDFHLNHDTCEFGGHYIEGSSGPFISLSTQDVRAFLVVAGGEASMRGNVRGRLTLYLSVEQARAIADQLLSLVPEPVAEQGRAA